jgi:enterochelin esterase family protein
VKPPLRLGSICAPLIAALLGCGGEDLGADGAAAGGGSSGPGSGTGAAGGSAAAAGGGGSGAEGGAACDRASATRTADVALYDALLDDLAGGAEPAATVEAFVQAVIAGGGTPLVDPSGERLVFLWRGEPSGTLGVAGSFADWQPGAVALERVGSTSLFAGEATLAKDQRHEYKLVDGDTYLEDPLAVHVAWDGIDHQGVGQMNAVIRPESGDPDAGRLVVWRGVHGEATNDERDVFVYLPATYDDPSCPRLPVIELHDGNESLTRAPFQQAADETYAQTPEASAILVFVALHAQEERMSEYTFGDGSEGDAYVAFLRDELRAFEAARLRTCTAPEDRGIAGASLGGLISAYAAFQSPEAWGYVGSQSGSFFWQDGAIPQRAAEDPVVDVRFYLDHGCPDDNCESNRDLADALAARGYELSHVEEPDGQHDWSYWKKRLPELLRYFRDGRSGCVE